MISNEVRDQRDKRSIGLDLMRALAILGVMLTHFVLPQLKAIGVAPENYSWVGFGGLAGVELFFALSGFLIGRLLLDIVEKDPSWRGWTIFLVRRWMRTVPLYLLVLAVLLLLRPPPTFQLYAAKYVSFMQNFAWPMPMDNWFGVSWSLPVEEWFYFLFSALLLAIAAKSRNVGLVVASAVFVILPILTRTLWGPVGDNWDWGFRKIVVFRLDAITYGFLVAWLCRYWPSAQATWRYPLVCIGLLGLGVAVYLRASQSFSHWGYFTYTLWPLSFSLMMPWGSQMSFAWAWLGVPFRWIAQRSYCLYLIHPTLLGVGWQYVPDGYRNARVSVSLLILFTCFAIADLSYRFFEMPILRRRPRQFAPTSDGRRSQSPELVSVSVP